MKRVVQFLLAEVHLTQLNTMAKLLFLDRLYNYFQVFCSIASSTDMVSHLGLKFMFSLSIQANNAYIFPGLGMGLVISGAIRVHDEMLLAACKLRTP